MKFVRRATHGALEITTVRDCSVNCHPHCPQLKFRAAYGEDDPRALSYEDFRASIATVPTDVFITFAGFAEPFLNVRALDMMELARRKGHRIKVFTTLVGLPPEKVDRFVRLAPEVFVPHLPDPDGIAHIPDTETWRRTFLRVMREMPAIHGYSRMDRAFVSNQRAGNCDGAPPLHVRGPLWCGKLVEPEFVLLPNGDVDLCCMTWRREHPIGNLLRQTWDELVDSEAYRAVVRESYRVYGSSACRRCTFAVPTFSGRRLVVAAKHAAERTGLVDPPAGTL